ncbi:Gfo/Idh/MocA family oxidoreductase [Streptomyces sp. TRM 70351]|uniref:Gfo/Idh/MocA family protein n=1 Tax=Streptomyces sp. TRM 70351 TaxID=3116552 RepID=UPI002E7AC6B4|nr:Gfo/Idh/MocA family oxidoreductase [Streptomyces sp. TRM 70351]MEE1929384.1 Gfo/Idh/MocA family oxidoreductase [Streptomyces sp. TRM 70351]
MSGAAAPVRLGVLGCADIAVRRVLPAVSRTPGVTLAAVASRSRERAARVTARFGGTAVGGYAELLERRGPDAVDAVYVPLPAALHATWVRRALDAGKHVLAEKPLTTDPGTTAALVERARAAGLVLAENYMSVHHPQHRAVLDLVAGGAIGRLRSLSAAFTIPPRPDDDIRYRADLGGGALLDVGCHPLRTASVLLGDGLAVAGAVLHRDAARGVDVSGSALLHRPDGVTAHVTFGMEHHYTSRYELHGSAGRLRLDHAFTPPADHRPTVVIERADGVEHRELAPYDQCRGTVAAFAAAVASGAARHGTAPPGPGTAGEAIVRQARLIAAVHRSAHDAVGGETT